MTMILLAVGLILLLMALTVFGSPFFAALFILPAVMLYFAVVARTVAEETSEDDLDPEHDEVIERPGSHPFTTPTDGPRRTWR